MTLTTQPLTGLLAAFRSPQPTPGGGSASALAGAVGASLLVMVAGLAKPKAATDAELAELRAAGARCGDLAARLEALVDRDSEAYDLVVTAFKRPKGSDEEKTARGRAIQEALVAATEAPLEVMRHCAAALDTADVVARLGNSNAASDVQVGVVLLSAGLRGAQQNVEINLGSLKDADYVARVRAEAARLAARAL